MTSCNGFPIWFKYYLRKRGLRKLRVIVMTYNTVWDYKDGMVNHGKHDLEVEIVCGGACARAYEDLDGEFIRLWGSERSKSTGVATVCNAATALQMEQTPLMILLYAGMTQFEEMCNLARQLHERGADVVLVTCGCDGAKTITPCDRLERDGVILESFNGFAGTPGNPQPCYGGRADLRDMVRAIVWAWPIERA